MAQVEEMEEVVFGCCGATVWLLRNFMKDKRETGGTFYCPNGHPRVFKKTKAEKLQEELDGVKASLSSERERVQKIKTGKCPFCWRTAKNLSAHIKKYHP